MTEWKGLREGFSPGDKVFCCFGDVKDEWHEMLVSAFFGPYATVLTRDEDHYIVHFTKDHTFVYPTGPQGGLPPRVRYYEGRGAALWRFDQHDYTEKQLKKVLAEGQKLLENGDDNYPAVCGRNATVIRRITGKSPPVRPGRKPAILPKDADAQDGPKVNDDMPKVDDDAPKASAVDEPALVWALAEPGGGHSIGDDVTALSPVAPSTLGEQVLLKVQGKWRRAEAVKVADIPTFAERVKAELLAAVGSATSAPAKPDEEGLDARALGIRMDGGSTAVPERFRSLHNALAACEPEEFEDWPLDQPRTTLWCGKETLKAGPSYTGRHNKWRIDNKLGEDDPGVNEHEVISEAFDLFFSYDQVDGSNLAGMERLCRRMQYIEEGYRQKLEEKKQTGKDAGLSTLSSYFDGRPKMAGGAIVSPALLKTASEAAAARNEILRQQRKAIEARALLKGPKR